jgi:hypothetical protein
MDQFRVGLTPTVAIEARALRTAVIRPSRTKLNAIATRRYRLAVREAQGIPYVHCTERTPTG